MLIRTVSDADLAAVAAIAAANGDDEGQDAGYVRQLRAAGRLLAAEIDGTVAGYCGTHPVGAATMLSDLFISPERQGAGVGGRLLTAALAGAAERFTFASGDPRAMPLYARHGMIPRWPLLYLRGRGAAALSGSAPRSGAAPRPGAPGLVAEEVPPADAARAELGITGQDRGASYAFWGPHALVVRDSGGQVLAAGAAGGAGTGAAAAAAAGAGAAGRLIHLVTAAGADPAATLFAALALVPGDQIRLCLPGPHPALRQLLDAGWRIDDLDHHMSSSDGLVSTRSVLSPSQG